MTSDLSALLGALAGRHVAVVGDALLDSYLEGYCERLCREAPVPNVTVTRRTDIPGGAANAAINVASLGGRVSFLTAVGDDPEGDLLCQALRRHAGQGHDE